MSFPLLLSVCTLCAYLIGGINPAILLSRLLYHQDIRALGSKNPGFTNFKRVYGNRHAWFVFLLDILKTAVLCAVFCPLFVLCGKAYALGAAYTGLCAMLGHVFLVWYHFKGGKGFLVGATAIWFIDWRTALIALAVWGLLLTVTKYMSLSVICAAFVCPFTLAALGEPTDVVLLCAAACLLLIVRHRENILRLYKGTESKFRLR